MSPEEMVAEYGTPLYVYDRAEIRRAYGELRSALPDPSRIYYSAKANPHPDVASVLAELGCHAEVSSTGETAAALAAGFRPDTIMLTGPGKTVETVAFALARGVRRFSAESPTDLARIGSAAVRAGVVADCLLRVNADQPVAGMGLTMTGAASQFGADASWLAAEPGRFRSLGVRVVGLHLYMGSNIVDADRLVEQFATSIGIAAELSDALDIEEIDLGGGFASPYARHGERVAYPDVRERVADLLDARFGGWREGAPTVSFESGRYLVGAAGTLLCSVVDVKVSKGRTFVVLDAGVHQLGGMSGLRRLPRVVPDLVVITAPRPVVADCVVTGPLCTPLDIWSDGVQMPQTQPGDLLAVPNVGAYGLTASLVAFLGHPPAAEVVVDGPAVVSVSRLTLDRISLTPAVRRGHRTEGVGR